MFGKCKACPCKDAHISDLQSQINRLHALLNPPRFNPTTLEAAVITNTNTDQIEFTPEKIKEDQKAHAEMMSILNASY